MSEQMAASRDRKVLRLSQCHLAPGMTLERQRELFERYGVGRDLRELPDWAIDELVREVSAIVLAAKNNREERSK